MTREVDQRKRWARRLGMAIRLTFRLATPAGVNVHDFAREAGVSTRTVFRWLNGLESAGVPYYFDEGDRVHRARNGWRPEDLSNEQS